MNPFNRYQLSENFIGNEVVKSRSFPELAEKVNVTLELILAAQLLAIKCLQPIRDKFGIVDVESWIRDEALNKAVGGTNDSDHLKGIAADIVPRNFHPEQVFKWCVLDTEIPYRQIIYYPDKKFIHISTNHPEKTMKNEAFVCVEPGKYVQFKEYYEK